jgi:hypothetical protein
MAQGDYLIQNQTFPSFRTDLNSTLEAINTSNSGTSRPSSAVAGTVWLDTTSATTPTLKFYDGADDISLATFDYSANTVNWLDSTVVFDIVGDTTPQLGGDLDVNGNSLVSTSNGDITFTPNGTGKVVISGLSFPTADGTADQVLKTDGSGNLSFASIEGRTGTVNWDTTPKTSTVTAANGVGYFVNTTAGVITVNLPAGSAGNIVAINDYANTAATNNIIISANGSEKIQGATTNKVLNINGTSTTLVYIDSTQGWKVVDTGEISSVPTQPLFITATGGTITCSGDYKIHTFTGPGTFCVSAVGNPVGGPNNVDYLVVAGGAGGAGRTGSGGGAGGFRESSGTASGCYTASPLGACVSALPVSVQGYPITVGAGGGGSPGGGCLACSGNPSTFSSITSNGGGGGHTSAGGPGGSGGGGGRVSPNTAGNGNTPPVSPPQGNTGGSGSTPNENGGGGGATATGTPGTSQPGGGPGGNGATSSITGSPVTRSGGGGASRPPSSPAGTGGTGGGGNGAASAGNGENGTDNTGGGGGGGFTCTGSGGSGGSGVVIIRYKYQ